MRPLDVGRPLPLVLYAAPSVSRAQMLAALDRDKRAYRTACLCRGFNGLVAAVSAGIGISAVAASMVPSSLVPLDGQPGPRVQREQHRFGHGLGRSPRCPSRPV